MRGFLLTILLSQKVSNKRNQRCQATEEIRNTTLQNSYASLRRGEFDRVSPSGREDLSEPIEKPSCLRYRMV